jgi:hypothetical protein
MNQNNYATLEACQRLVDAEIVLETDFYWSECYYYEARHTAKKWEIVTEQEKEEWQQEVPTDKYIPAPSMAEVWRELPEKMKLFRKKKALHFEKWKGESYASYENGLLCKNINPTDALIDLLIWVKAQKEGKDEEART